MSKSMLVRSVLAAGVVASFGLAACEEKKPEPAKPAAKAPEPAKPAAGEPAKAPEKK